MTSNLRMIVIAAAAVVVVAAGAIYWYVGRTETVVIAEAGSATADSGVSTPAIAQGGPLLEPGPLGEMTLGDPNAPNVVIEYASMTCPHCQRFHVEVMPAFKERFIDTGRVYYMLREFPLDPLATAAIMIARCAPEERFFPLVDLMFENQRQWAFVQDPTSALRDLVRQAGISADAFQACLTNQEILDGVNAVKNRASQEFGVGSTPTFFVNGQLLRGDTSLEAFESALRS